MQWTYVPLELFFHEAQIFSSPLLLAIFESIYNTENWRLHEGLSIVLLLSLSKSVLWGTENEMENMASGSLFCGDGTRHAQVVSIQWSIANIGAVSCDKWRCVWEGSGRRLQLGHRTPLHVELWFLCYLPYIKSYSNRLHFNQEEHGFQSQREVWAFHTPTWWLGASELSLLVYKRTTFTGIS